MVILTILILSQGSRWIEITTIIPRDSTIFHKISNNLERSVPVSNITVNSLSRAPNELELDVRVINGVPRCVPRSLANTKKSPSPAGVAWGITMESNLSGEEDLPDDFTSGRLCFHHDQDRAARKTDARGAKRWRKTGNERKERSQRQREKERDGRRCNLQTVRDGR